MSSHSNNRLGQIKGHFTGGSQREHLINHRHPDDVVIVSAVRTPICRAGKGGFKDMYPEDLLAVALKAAAERAKIDPKVVNDIQTGNVLQELGGIKVGRAAMFCAGFPYTTTYGVLNRQCSSGLQACNYIANAIKAGELDVGIGAGVESMTHDYGSKSMPSRISSAIKAGPGVTDVFYPMGITSENVASDFKITREDQDLFSADSHAKALKAQELGLFNAEIVPVKVQLKSTVKDENGEEKQIVKEVIISKDEGPRPGSTPEKLAKLKPVFKKDGSTTAGNASQVSDGAAAVVLMRRSKAEELGCTILARWCGARVVGCPPRIMGIGPAVAIPAVLDHLKLNVDDVDIYELNEAFASQALYCIRTIGLKSEKVNPKGGAIALGHPLGMTGARQMATLISQLHHTNQKIGVISMCYGIGGGMAAVIMSSNDLISNITCLTSKKNHEEALRILKKVATMVRPIMKAHGWKTTTLAEFYTKGLLGMNTNSGWKIQLCLRYHSDENRFLPWEEIIGTMLHELAHNIRGPHDEKFYKALNDLNNEYDKVIASGYTGEGFDSNGQRLGTKNGRVGPGGMRLGGAIGAASPTAAARAAAVLAAEKRRQVNEMMLPAGGRKLGGGGGGSKIDSTANGFWEQWHSPGELATMAAERRAKDQIWCGSSSAGDSQEMETNHDRASISTPIKAQNFQQGVSDKTVSIGSNAPEERKPRTISAASSKAKREASLDQGQELNDTTVKKLKSVISDQSPANDRPMSMTAHWLEWACPACTLLNRPLSLQLQTIVL
ncbi:hypothetical protein BGX27_002028 [Mortierella sp. AM989]|nr:hypothetical protein BGX27_002028 [Mortierella sp. AM989]